MFDHAALGTALIGLEAVRREQELTDTPVSPRPRKARSFAFRAALAGVLRGVAEFVEPRRRSSSPNRA